MIINSFLFGQAYTARTTAFATATGITDATILGALNTFDLGLISNSLDSKIKALYPYVGGTASTHKFNFLDARDLDVSYRLTFNGGFVHNSNGVTSNGVNTFADPHFAPSNFTDYFKAGLGQYSRTNETGLFVDGLVYNTNFNLYWKANTYGFTFEPGTSFVNYTVADSLGLMVGSMISSTSKSVYKNGIKLATDTTLISNNTVTASMYLFANRLNLSGTAGYFGTKTICLHFISEGFTDTDQTNFYNLVQNLQTSLGRQV